MDTATVTVPSCQLVDLNNNCQCRSTGAPRTRAPQALEVSAALLKPFVQLRRERKQLIRIVRSSIQKRHNPKWHPYRVELQQATIKSTVDQAEQIVEGAIDRQSKDCGGTANKSKELAGEKLETVA
uniref:Uncharacterized protein n=1 Tax=Anopheles coluzzii TaxID=1518534 RepID=A0A8W7P177_ANOCL